MARQNWCWSSKAGNHVAVKSAASVILRMVQMNCNYVKKALGSGGTSRAGSSPVTRMKNYLKNY